MGLGFDSEIHSYHTAKYGKNSWWSDRGLMNRIDDEFNRLHSLNGNRNGHLVEMAQSAKEERKIEGIAQNGNAAMNEMIQKLLEENKKLKGEVNQWKTLNQDLYKSACKKVSGSSSS